MCNITVEPNEITKKALTITDPQYANIMNSFWITWAKFPEQNLSYKILILCVRFVFPKPDNPNQMDSVIDDALNN